MEIISGAVKRSSGLELATSPPVSLKWNVLNLEKFWDQKKFGKFLSSLEVQFTKFKKIYGHDFGIISFKDHEQKEIAKTILESQVICGKKLKCRDGSNQLYKKQRTENTDSLPTNVKDLVTSLWNLPYEKQLELKESKIKKGFQDLVKNLKAKSSYELPIWLKNTPKNFTFCEFQGVIASPVIYGYRNKTQFTIGFDQNEKPCVGYVLGKMKLGFTSIGDPSECTNIPEISKKIRNIVQEHIEKSASVPYNKKTYQGFWRELTIRTHSTGETMVIVQVNGKNNEELLREKSELIEKFKNEAPFVTSLFIQNNCGLSEVSNEPFELLLGNNYVHEKILGLKFRISPAAFFQVNTTATEILYGIVRDWCQKDHNMVVLDICCGTGTIGLTIAKEVKKVIGIEMCQEAVNDAVENAKSNGIENAEYIVGKAEDVLAKQLTSLEKQNCIAVVDPPRAGLHSKTIHAIRKCNSINHLIFVSCDVKGLIATSLDLCRSESRNLKGSPFKPVKSVAVDLFPSTENVEVVILFEREAVPVINEQKEETKEKEELSQIDQ